MIFCMINNLWLLFMLMTLLPNVPRSASVSEMEKRNVPNKWQLK